MSYAELLQEMVDGYMDGFYDSKDGFPKESNRGCAYKHGWLNGRDDRKGNPRLTYDTLKAQAEMILNSTLDNMELVK